MLLEDVFQKDYEKDTVSGAGVYTEDKKTLFLLSADDLQTGVSYVESVCVPHLSHKYSIRKDAIVIRCVGADEKWLKSILSEAQRMGNGCLTVSRVGQFGEDVIRIFYDSATPKMLTDDVLRFLVEKLNENIYALDDTPLEVQLIQLLRLRGRRVSVAESFTGGGVGKRIVSISGASDVYFEGLNTYAESSKMQRLGVSEYTLRTQGAVSEQTAYEMAAGLLATGNCQVAISTTGLAGPNSDSSGLPVGLCCIGIGIEDKVYVYRYRLDGDRETITQTAINYALFLACKQIKNL
jgi:nicotinamide-nucleotide amidase